MSLQEYLAKNYGSLDSDKKHKKSKKSKKKSNRNAAGMSLIIDDDELDFAAEPITRNKDAPDVSKEPRRKPKFKDAQDSWRTVGAVNPIDAILLGAQKGDGSPVDAEELPAVAEGAELVGEYMAEQRRLKEAALREKQQERARRKSSEHRHRPQSQPAVRTGTPPSPAASAGKYGLQSAESVKEDEQKERERWEARMRRAGAESTGKDAETVYRDTKTGKKIDIAQAAADEAERRQTEEAAKRRQADWNKGLVQRREAAEELQMIERIRAGKETHDAVAARIDEEKRKTQHWDDPALKFIEDRRGKSRHPEFKGYCPPNRFGIRPGYRWDGVDRSNGYEAEFFKRQADASTRRTEAYLDSVADW